MKDQVDRVNSIARRLRECEGHMRFMRWEKRRTERRRARSGNGSSTDTTSGSG